MESLKRRMRDSNPQAQRAVGYSIFTCDDRAMEITKNYIDNQEEHHKRKYFMKRYMIYFKKYALLDRSTPP